MARSTSSGCRRGRASGSRPARRWRASRHSPPADTACSSEPAGTSRPTGMSARRRSRSSSATRPTSRSSSRCRCSGSGGIACTASRRTSRAGCVPTPCARRWHGSTARRSSAPSRATSTPARSTRCRRSSRRCGRSPNAWLHVDGAFGLWAAAVPELRDRVAGLAGADSWTTDAHKWLNVPYDSGIVIVRDAAAHHASMTLGAAYYVETAGGERDPYNWVAESSRRARGFAVYAALKSLGRSGLAEMIARCCALARRMADGLRGAEGVTILNEVVLNQVLVRFSPPGSARRRRGGDGRFHPARHRRGPGRRDVLARRHDMARAWPRCGSRSRTGRPPRPTPTSRSRRSCAARARSPRRTRERRISLPRSGTSPGACLAGRSRSGPRRRTGHRPRA